MVIIPRALFNQYKYTVNMVVPYTTVYIYSKHGSKYGSTVNYCIYTVNMVVLQYGSPLL